MVDEGPDFDRSDINIKPSKQYTVLFNSFVFLQIFNEINARRLDSGFASWNAFQMFFTNWVFLAVLGATTVLQVIFVEAGGNAIFVVRLSFLEWLYSFLIGATMIPFGTLMRVFVPVPNWHWLKYQKPVSQKKPKKKKEEMKPFELAEITVSGEIATTVVKEEKRDVSDSKENEEPRTQKEEPEIVDHGPVTNLPEEPDDKIEMTRSNQQLLTKNESSSDETEED